MASVPVPRRSGTIDSGTVPTDDAGFREPPFTPSDAMSQDASTSPLRLIGGSLSIVGTVREHNEDAALVEPDLKLFAVADGLGGHQAGELASQTAIDVLTATVRDAHEAGQAPELELLLDAFDRANTSILEDAREHPERDGMGTTLTALLAAGDVFLLAHVGDCRAWRFRGGKMEQLTHDHTLVAQQLREGVLSEDEAADHPMRHVLSRCLGVREELEVDLREIDLAADDIYIVASDGLLLGMEPVRMTAILRDADEPAETARRLVESACARNGGDNITAVVVRCQRH